LFVAHEEAINRLLSKAAPSVVQKIPSIYARLDEGDTEAISQAMTSCRRMIDAFADHVSPPAAAPVQVDGVQVSLKKDKVLNRIQQYLVQNMTSESRRDRLNKTLRAIYERVSTGVHSDVSAQEARSLFLATYLTLGEILTATG
jgi:hypothetical protein